MSEFAELSLCVSADGTVTPGPPPPLMKLRGAYPLVWMYSRNNFTLGVTNVAMPKTNWS